VRCDELCAREQMYVTSWKTDSDVRQKMALEVNSLQVVLDQKNDEIRQLRQRQSELDTKVLTAECDARLLLRTNPFFSSYHNIADFFFGSPTHRRRLSIVNCVHSCTVGLTLIVRPMSACGCADKRLDNHFLFIYIPPVAAPKCQSWEPRGGQRFWQGARDLRDGSPQRSPGAKPL